MPSFLSVFNVQSRSKLRLASLLAVSTVLIGSAGVHPVSAEPADIDCTKVKCIALTFDDGPGPSTDRLLEILQQNNAKATFFVIGNKVVANPGPVQRAAAAGHQIGNHTWDHPNMTQIEAPWVTFQLIASQLAIQNAIGTAPTIYRPAGGLSNDFIRSEASKFGLAEILWDVIPFDWMHEGNPGKTMETFKYQVYPGSVALFHDTYWDTVVAIDLLLPWLKEQGYHMVTVDKLLGKRAPGSTYGGRVYQGPPVADSLPGSLPGTIPNP
ncbi:MAG: polysaccharide deacetylase family protein [Mycobacteriaceae bacterium]